MTGPADTRVWYAPNWSETDRYDARSIRARLEIHAVIYIGQRDRQRVALDMERQGEVVCWAGTGPDQGTLLVRRSRAVLRVSAGDDGGAA